MNFYMDEICVLLGHNAAGKTTTLQILAGMISQTSGSIQINGVEITQDYEMEKNGVGQQISFCPQDNTLFDYLTVQEHFEMYIGLRIEKTKEQEKGGKNYKNNQNLLNDAQKSINTLIEDLDLTEHRHKLAKYLSGGN